jgi:RimJ/RimL family protein N-acetyltransferase
MATAPEPFVAPVLRAPGVILRPWARDDAEALEAACGDLDICRFTTVPERYSRGEAEAWIERQHGRLAEGGVVLAIVPREAPRPVGTVGLFGLGPHQGPPRFGYWVVRDQRGRGLAATAARALGRWARDELAVTELLLDVEPGNGASHRVAAKLGAERLGEIERQLAGRSVALVRYAVPAASL